MWEYEKRLQRDPYSWDYGLQHQMIEQFIEACSAALHIPTSVKPAESYDVWRKRHADDELP